MSRPGYGGVSRRSLLLAAETALLCLMAAPLRAMAFAGGPEATEKFLGLPVDIWKTLNLVVILGVLVYFLGKPFNDFFRKRREELDERLEKAIQDRDEATRLLARMEERLGGLSEQVEQIRRRGVAEGETEKRLHLELAVREADELSRHAGEEIDRRLAVAKAQLARAAADLAADSAREMVGKMLQEEDRHRFFQESVEKVAGAHGK